MRKADATFRKAMRQKQAAAPGGEVDLAAEINTIVAPSEGVEGAPFIVIGNHKFVAEPASIYKMLQALAVMSRVLSEPRSQELLSLIAQFATPNGQDNATRIGLMGIVLPRAMDIAPQVVFDLLALLVSSNAELHQAWKRPNGVHHFLRDRAEHLMFNTTADQLQEILDKFIPMLDLDALKNGLWPTVRKALTPLTAMWNAQVKATQEAMGVPEPSVSSETSISSP